MKKKITLNELRRLVEKVLNEDSGVEISFEKNEVDERGPKKKQAPSYSVNYVLDEREEGLFFQFSGTLLPYHTGRETEYEFSPSWFQDDESEQYYDNNWEKIEDQILDKFYEEER